MADFAPCQLARTRELAKASSFGANGGLASTVNGSADIMENTPLMLQRRLVDGEGPSVLNSKPRPAQVVLIDEEGT